jgi:hypothetical protein
VTGRRKVGVKRAATAAGPLLSIISYPPTARSRGGLLQTSDGSILGRDDDESKAASGGRRRNRKDEVEMVWVCQWGRFQRLRMGITWLPLRAASRVSGPASENRCPGRAILPPTVTQIELDIAREVMGNIKRGGTAPSKFELGM